MSIPIFFFPFWDEVKSHYVFICISLRASESEHFFICVLDVWISSFETCPFLNCCWASCTHYRCWTLFLYQLQSLQILSHIHQSASANRMLSNRLPLDFIGGFLCRAVFLAWCNAICLFFVLIPAASGVLSKKPAYSYVLQSVLIFSSNNLMVSGHRSRSLIHLDVLFLYHGR